MSGEIDEMSLKLGVLAGTVEALTAQQSAVFRKMDEQNEKLAALNTTFSGYSQQTLAAIAGADRRIYVLEEKHDPLDTRVDDLEAFRTEHATQEKAKAKNMLMLFGVGGVSGGFISQLIDFLKGIGHS